ncbi:MAG: hypothetical protein ACLP1Y_12370 [Candidatus Acidiferrales bacterium]
MNRWVRLPAAVIYLLGIFAAIVFLSWPVLLALTLVAFVLHAGLLRSLRLAVHKLVPVIGFALIVTLLQWWGGRKAPLLGLQSLFVFQLLSVFLFLFAPRGLALPERGSPLYRIVLYLLFVRHFAAILAGEVHRTLRAHGMAVQRRFGPQAMHSLVHALTSVFGRCLTRAERFYAAQWLRGLDN